MKLPREVDLLEIVCEPNGIADERFLRHAQVGSVAGAKGGWKRALFLENVL
jgi:hypothetical protein